MDEYQEHPQEQTDPAPKEGYAPRPRWQVWAARVGLVLFILFILYQLLQIAGGGL